MKYITSTLLMIVGMQAPLNAELIYYEKIFEDITSKEFMPEEGGQLEQGFNELNVETELGTIRLEEGEVLSQPSQKLIRSYVQKNQWGTSTERYPFFKMIINYDRFSKDEIIEITCSSDQNWYTQRNSSLVFSKGNQWPIEGPATITVTLKPYVVQLYSQFNPRKYKNIRPEQFYRISFTKSVSQFRVSQNQLQALVLPKGVEGMSVIMESSEDLVNWTRDTLGRKPTANRPKFFRLRALKE
ncbi:hypothetical protein OAA59_00605 [bacterium]|nr:hypothetical protein [bacterium]